ncbi:hypothetical protein OPIT5_04430 [Opitutaceae bacterium TAV5]|nr:hypothetical protein OPIT5_04430 [Opitutaceae bacterium TAV5]
MPASLQPEAIDEFSRRRYLTYPHANGFAGGGRFLVLGQQETTGFSLWRCDLSTGEEQRLGVLPADVAGDPLWFDIALRSGRLVTVTNNEVWCCDVLRPGSADRIYREEAPGACLQSLPSISADGERVLVVRRTGDNHAVMEITTITGQARVLFSVPWHAGHVHFSPCDETWIGFCHEGRADAITDRVQAWHAHQAPEGMCLLDQRPAGLWLGHERWAFHAPTVLVVAYGGSPGKPRGVYELFHDRRPPRLVSEGDRDWHVNVSRDGRWAVVDTTGPHDRPGRGWEEAENISDVLLIDLVTGRRTFLARSRRGANHPRHPHPVFSPDGETVFYNETAPDGDAVRVMRVGNPLRRAR